MVSCCTGALQMHGAHGLVMPSFSSDYDGGDFAFSICYSILSRPHLTMACKRKVLERIYGFWKLRIMKMLQFFFPSWIQTTISFLINLHLRSRRLLGLLHQSGTHHFRSVPTRIDTRVSSCPLWRCRGIPRGKMCRGVVRPLSCSHERSNREIISFKHKCFTRTHKDVSMTQNGNQLSRNKRLWCATEPYHPSCDDTGHQLCA